MKDVAIFPVRHHSPRASAALARYLDRVQPELVLVEGPRDATRLIPYLFDPDTMPPVAILGYRTEGSPQSVLYPFATYSPEYVALKWAVDHGVRAELIDITTGETLAADREAMTDDLDEEDDAEPGVAAEKDLPPSEDDACGPTEAEIAKTHGFRSFEELWEAWFEAPDHAPDDFVKALLAWGEVVRGRDRIEYHRARDARMVRHIRDAIASGIAAAKIAVVVGAAHAAAFVMDDVDPALEAKFTASVPTEITLIPYSFTRLAAQLGYGAGNRAPRYYQKAHDAGCDYTRATLEVLIEFTEHLRVRGFAASLADTIEAYRLAVTLASIRDKHAPGLDEIREATIATMCRGDASHVDSFLWPSVIGKTVGKVGARIGKNSLQTEFWREVEAKGLPRSDDPEDFTLKLGDLVQAQTSVFLHRLRIGEISYASYGGSQAIMQRGAPVTDEVGGVAALSRVREHWTAQWTPSTDVALVERIIYGDTLLQVAERRLGEALTLATGAASAANVLMEAVVAAAPQVLPEALAATERLAAIDEDVLSLARATRALSGLVSFGTSRDSISGAESVIGDLADKTFTRAVLRIEGASLGDDEAVMPARNAIRILHEIAVSQARFDTSLWFTTASELVASERIHPACAGMLAGLLYLAERLDEAAVTAIVSFRLSNTIDPGAAAGFLEGFLSVNALVLVKNRAIVAALDGFLQSVEAERFRDVLPVLRRAFSALGATERRYLLENLLASRKIGEHAREAKQVLASKDVDKLKAMSEDIAKAMDDLDDLL
ncbi:MAG: hypothetical protein H0T42_24550 [Deltaproteobacteria bacterium]|nr:hypothetical protein [Deltaproteobacteria bacterium]